MALNFEKNTGFATQDNSKIKYEHETAKVNAETDLEKNRIEAEKEASKLKLENEANEQKADFWLSILDRIFSPSFLSFLVILSLVVVGGYIVWKRPFENALDFWNLILPIITSFMGYAFGRQSTAKKLKKQEEA
ncbi:hypothetical protein [Vibrio ordalii]|uniref:hypothetical protein n=1 Tax=Vibrio ordalii TaxID=28174 RepID=UPI0002EE672A|nr:hypothetical protein [Vibrio ordalii]OEE76383.1 hypothetical protein A1QQ_15350 [Vibrio ordalii FF-167]